MELRSGLGAWRAGRTEPASARCVGGPGRRAAGRSTAAHSHPNPGRRHQPEGVGRAGDDPFQTSRRGRKKPALFMDVWVVGGLGGWVWGLRGSASRGR